MDIVCCVASSADEGTGCAGGVGGGAEGAAAPAAPAPYDAKVSAGELGSCGGEQGRVGGGRRLKGGAGACPRLHLPPGLRRAGRRTTAADAVHVRCGHGGLCTDEQKSGGRITEGVDARRARLSRGTWRGEDPRGPAGTGCAAAPAAPARQRNAGECGGVGRGWEDRRRSRPHMRASGRGARGSAPSSKSRAAAPRPGARHSASANGAPQAGISEYLPLLDSVNLIFLRSETRTTRTRTAGRAGRPPGQGTTIRVRHPSTPRRPWGGVAVRETDRRIYFEILKTCICNFTVFTTTGAASGTGKRGLGRLYRPPASSLRGAVSSRESNQEQAPRRGRIRAPLRICTRRT